MPIRSARCGGGVVIAWLGAQDSFGQAAWCAVGAYSWIAPMFFNRGSSLNPRTSVKAKPARLVPWVSV